MEPKNQQSSQPKSSDDDVDLGQLLYRAGGVVQSFFNWLARLFLAMGQLILLFLFFLRRNILWLALGAVIGICYGFFLVSKNGARYTSELTVRANFNSSLALYSTVSYLNALIASGETTQLAKIFSVSPKQAESLKFFEVNPISSELNKADLYREKFLNYERQRNLRGDSVWSHLIKYPDFKNSLTKYDYPLHEIDLTATDPAVFPHVQDGLIREISANRLLQTLKDTNAAINKESTLMLKSALSSIDTLRNAYSRRIGSGHAGSQDQPANNLTLLGSGTEAVEAPELRIYDKLLDLQDELKSTRKAEVMEDNIIQVYSSFGALGHQESFFRQSVVRFGLTGLLLAFIIVIFVSGYKYLKHLEQMRSRTPSGSAG